MIEVVPKHPFEFQDLFNFQENLCSLYRHLDSKMGKDKILSISPFPILGANKTYFLENLKYIGEDQDVNTEDIASNCYSKSIYLNDIIINRHPRFGYFF